MISDTTVDLLNPFSCCCIKMGCGFPKVWPQELSFVLDLSNACPQLLGGVGILSGTLRYGLACEPPSAPPDCAGLCANWNNFFCGGVYSWCVETPPLCGPFVTFIVLDCIPGPAFGLAEGAAGCPNAPSPPNKCLWRMQAYVARAFRVTTDPFCPGIAGDPPPPYHCKQDCETCEWGSVEGAGDPECCPTCPPCTDCAAHHEQLCEANEICCATGVFCPQCPPCPDGHQCEGDCYASCTACIQTDVSGSQPEDSSCVGYCGGISYHHVVVQIIGTMCMSPNDIRGCDPNTCLPANQVADHQGNFFLHLQCNNDYFQAACP